MKYIINTLLLLSVLMFTACSKSQEVVEINDLLKLSQDPVSYTENLPNLDLKLQKKLDETFNEIFFKPWELKNLSYTSKQASWGNMYAKKKMYGENHKLISKQWFDKQISNANFEQFDTSKRYAITTNNSNMRVFPTKSAMFYNPKQAGEGFPFDYNQNSSIKLNTPLYVSHFSQDKAWGVCRIKLCFRMGEYKRYCFC